MAVTVDLLLGPIGMELQGEADTVCVGQENCLSNAGNWREFNTVFGAFF